MSVVSAAILQIVFYINSSFLFFNPQWQKKFTRVNLILRRRTISNLPNKLRETLKLNFHQAAKRRRKKLWRNLQRAPIKERNKLLLWDFFKRNDRRQYWTVSLFFIWHLRRIYFVTTSSVQTDDWKKNIYCRKDLNNEVLSSGHFTFVQLSAVNV